MICAPLAGAKPDDFTCPPSRPSVASGPSPAPLCIAAAGFDLSVCSSRYSKGGSLDETNLCLSAAFGGLARAVSLREASGRGPWVRARPGLCQASAASAQSRQLRLVGLPRPAVHPWPWMDADGGHAGLSLLALPGEVCALQAPSRGSERATDSLPASPYAHVCPGAQLELPALAQCWPPIDVNMAGPPPCRRCRRGPQMVSAAPLLPPA